MAGGHSAIILPHARRNKSGGAFMESFIQEMKHYLNITAKDTAFLREQGSCLEKSPTCRCYAQNDPRK
jgi:hypothetical protein